MTRLRLTADLGRLERLGRELSRKGGGKLVRALRPLMALRPDVEGDRLADILEIEL